LPPVRSDGEPGHEGCEGLRWQAELHVWGAGALKCHPGLSAGKCRAEPARSGDSSAPAWRSPTAAADTPSEGTRNRLRPSCRLL